MTNNVIFKKFEVIGKTKDEAMNQSNLTLMVDATNKYNKWAKEHTTDEASVKEFMKNYLHEKKYDKPGLAAYIVLQSGSKNTRQRPYEIKTIKYDSKTHTAEHYYVLRDLTNAEVGRCKTKREAEQLMRDYITDYQEDVYVYHEWAPKEKNALVMTGKYTPSKGTQPYKLLVFGYESVD